MMWLSMTKYFYGSRYTILQCHRTDQAVIGPCLLSITTDQPRKYSRKRTGFKIRLSLEPGFTGWYTPYQKLNININTRGQHGS